MTILDFLLLAALAGGALYVVYRLFVGWLHTRSAGSATEESD
jgi:hypothetical protein